MSKGMCHELMGTIYVLSSCGDNGLRWYLQARGFEDLLQAFYLTTDSLLYR